LENRRAYSRQSPPVLFLPRGPLIARFAVLQNGFADPAGLQARQWRTEVYRTILSLAMPCTAQDFERVR
jgi:hypothetical protein